MGGWERESAWADGTGLPSEKKKGAGPGRGLGGGPMGGASQEYTF